MLPRKRDDRFGDFKEQVRTGGPTTTAIKRSRCGAVERDLSTFSGYRNRIAPRKMNAAERTRTPTYSLSSLLGPSIIRSSTIRRLTIKAAFWPEAIYLPQRNGAASTSLNDRFCNGLSACDDVTQTA